MIVGFVSDLGITLIFVFAFDFAVVPRYVRVSSFRCSPPQLTRWDSIPFLSCDCCISYPSHRNLSSWFRPFGRLVQGECTHRNQVHCSTSGFLIRAPYSPPLLPSVVITSSSHRDRAQPPLWCFYFIFRWVFIAKHGAGSGRSLQRDMKMLLFNCSLA
jgi:hypothetical protein